MNTWQIFGRSLTLDQLNRDVLLIIYSSMALLFLLTLVLEQGSLFVPLILVALSPLAGVLLAESPSTGAAFLLAGATVMAILIQGERAGSTLTSLRYLTLAILAFPILLTLSWMSDTSPAQFLSWIPFFLLVAFLILLFSFPFHIWVAPTVSESQSLIPVVVFGLVQIVIVVFCFRLIVENPVAYGNARLLQLLRASGGATLVLATALILTAPSIGRLIGYLLIIDLGSTAIALGLGGRIGLELASYLVMTRVVGLLMAGFGLGMIRRQFTSTTADKHLSFRVETLARRSPIGLVLIIYGGLSLAGMPLTPGFAGRWTLVDLTSNQYQWLAYIIVISVVAAGIGLARMMLPNSVVEEGVSNSGPVESKALRITAAIILAIGILFALVSPIVLSFAQNLVNVL